MSDRTITDPVFGKLIWNGIQHNGWGGSFVSPKFFAWGESITKAIPDDEPDDEPVEPKPSSQELMSQFLSIAGDELQGDESGKQVLQALQNFAKRVDHYDGSLDAGPLRKSGRLKLVVLNGPDNPPTEAQQAAWNSFLENQELLEEQTTLALFKTYQQQRPERIRWWNIVYGDSPARVIPDIQTPEQMRAIIRPKEFRIHGEQLGSVAVAIIFESFWCGKDVKVTLRNRKIDGVAEHEDRPGVSVDQATREIDSPVFGRLRRGGFRWGWVGQFHSDFLRGYADASRMRYRFRNGDLDELRTRSWRPGPSWNAITGNYELRLMTDDDELPSPEQESEFAKFNASPKATANLVLSAILDWYQSKRPNWVDGYGNDAEYVGSV